jgi:hypothetical protein
MLSPFPFSESEWDRVNKAAAAVTNATLQDDDVLAASKLVELQLLLASLRDVHGEHPILLETEADFLNDPAERRELYLQAIDGALHGKIPTYTIRISLAALLLDSFVDCDAARNELMACKVEVMELGDSGEQLQWNQLLQMCS